MLVIKDKNGLTSYLSSYKKGSTIGLVPTMGALHNGHVSLVQKAVSENDLVIVSIFVNPTQFNNSEDLIAYPRTIAADQSLLQNVSDNIVIFNPAVAEIYSDHIMAKTYDFDGLDRVMEGEFRKNHFNGVGTIVEELFRLVQPDRAYFGEKDYQQLQIIRKLVQIKGITTDIIGCPIIREPGGLAMSSRNERLSESNRKEASSIYRILRTAKGKFGTKSAKKVVEWVKSEFKKHPKLQLEYIDLREAETLKPLIRKQKNKKYRAFIAVYVQDVRLIDNIAL